MQSHSHTQQTIALSSGEAKLYAIGAGAADSLFIRSLLLEACLIPRVRLFVHTDSTAGKSVASRYGTSRETRHVQLRHLFGQELVTSGMITIRKVLGILNNADILTKYVNKETFGEACRHFRPKAWWYFLKPYKSTFHFTRFSARAGVCTYPEETCFRRKAFCRNFP